MNLGNNATLVGASIYVVAVAVLISGNDVVVPPSVSTSLQMSQFVFLARTIPVVSEEAPARESSGVSDFLVRPLETLAHRPIASTRDRLRGAAVAIVFDARELVPLFVGPVTGTDAVARLLVEWSFDPGAPVSQAGLDAVRGSRLDDHLKDPVIAALAESSGLTTQAAAARMSAAARWGRTLTVGALLGFLMAAIMVAGAVLWFRTRRLSLVEAPEDPMDRESILPIVRVFVYFLAVFLTVGVLAPVLAGDLGDGLSLPTLVVLSYVVTGTVGLWLIGKVGRRSPDDRWSDLLGLTGSFTRGRFRGSALWALAAYCMIWPAVLGTSILSSGLFGEGGGVFENPVAVFLATESNPALTGLLLLSVTVLAPVFEEPLFRGFLYGRLRIHMKPIPAALVSGLIFGAAHMSLTNFLPLAAIGFTLALAYERTRDLATPMLAHAAWNFGEAVMLLTVFR